MSIIRICFISLKSFHFSYLFHFLTKSGQNEFVCFIIRENMFICLCFRDSMSVSKEPLYASFDVTLVCLSLVATGNIE